MKSLGGSVSAIILGILAFSARRFLEERAMDLAIAGLGDFLLGAAIVIIVVGLFLLPFKSIKHYKNLVKGKLQ